MTKPKCLNRDKTGRPISLINLYICKERVSIPDKMVPLLGDHLKKFEIQKTIKKKNVNTIVVF